MRIYNPTITGSLTLSGSLVATQTLDVTVTTASYAITASHALNATAESSSFATTASYSISSSHAEFSDSSTTSTSASFATTSSHSEFADQAGTSTSASFSTTASHAEFSDESGTSTSSSYATTASHAEFSDEASTAASSTSASYATTSSFAISSSHSEFADDAASATSSSFALTASFALNAGSGGSVDTGSLLVTASATTNVITFTKGDSSTFAITVDTGSGGGGTTETLEYNGQVRYEIISGSSKAQIVSTGNVYKNLSWSRSSTTLTVTSTAHGLSTGDNVLIRNMSEDYELKSITTSGNDSFTCTVADSGDTSGTLGAYIPAFDCSTIDLTTGVVTVTAPGAGNLQLNSMMVYAPSSESDPITVNIPAGDSNSGGINSALDTRFPPLVTFYKLDQATPVISTTTTVSYSKTANFSQYTIGGGSPDTFGAVQFILRF